MVIGDSAGAQVTICVSETFGEFTRAGGYSDGLYLELLDKIDSTAPHLLGWVGNIIKAIF